MRARPLLLAVPLLVALGCDSSSPPANDAGTDASAAPCARDLDCDDGLYCNGPERCAPDAGGADRHGCVRATSPCTAMQTCDEGNDRCMTNCQDADGDGFGASSCGGSDCDDTNPHRYPGNLEICDAIDQDCDPMTLGYRDDDRDGHTWDGCCNPPATGGTPVCGDDCDDTSSLVSAGATEVCDGRDNDCNGMIDDGTGAVDWYPDGDADGFGDPAGSPISSCALVDGRAPNHGDCDDTRARRSPGAAEVCDGIDNDCDTRVDESALPLPWFEDYDNDGFGDPMAVPVASCAPLPGHALVATDCDDEDPTRNPAQPEVCDARDNDCDTMVDEGVPDLHFYADADGDGFGTSSDAILACRSDATHQALNAGDCDDTRAFVNPRGVEVCNGLDDDCNRITDGSCFADLVTTPASVGAPSQSVVVACGANEVMVGVQYASINWCDLGGCSQQYTTSIAAICMRELMVGSPLPPVRYSYAPYGEHIDGPATGTAELRCPPGSVVTGVGSNDTFRSGLGITCTALGLDPTAFAMGPSVGVAWASATVNSCPPETPLVVSFQYSNDGFFGITNQSLVTCASATLVTSLP